MNITFDPSLLNDKEQKALSLLSEKFGLSLGKGTLLKRIICQEKVLTVSLDGDLLTISAPHLPAFFRGVALAAMADDLSAPIREEIIFDTNGLMFDCSRNGVLTVERTKDFLMRLAVMGMTVYLPYMEDVYEIDGIAQFGYMRGRYSVAEMKEIDEFAALFGIEVIPCIQTLAHMNQFLRYGVGKADYKDIDDILLVGSEKVNQLIDKMFATLSSCFRSRRIHIGMDEAYNLGRGKYLDANGYHSKSEIMSQQLNIVRDIAKKHGYESLMMWDDMFFNNADSSADMTHQKPDDILPVYWDYYNVNPEHYRQDIDKRLACSKDMVFAGGAWRWTGLVPHHTFTIRTSAAALSACIEKGVRHLFTTAWGDDGSGTPADASFLGAAMFAWAGYGHSVEGDGWKPMLEFISGMDFDTWMLQEQADYFEEAFVNETHVIANYALYSDPLCSIYDAHLSYLEKYNPTKIYADAEAKLMQKADLQTNDYNRRTLRVYGTLCGLLKHKWNLGIVLSESYAKADKTAIRKIIDEQIAPSINAAESLRAALDESWLSNFKCNGLEVQDLRIGGVSGRLKSVRDLLERYINDDKEADEALSCLREERFLISKPMFSWCTGFGTTSTAGIM